MQHESSSLSIAEQKTNVTSLVRFTFAIAAFVIGALFGTTASAFVLGGADGRLYFWGLDGSNGWSSDSPEEQRTIVQSAYIAPGRHVVASSQAMSRPQAVVDSRGDIYILRYANSVATTTKGTSSPDAWKIKPPPGRRATSIATGSDSWLATLDDGSVYVVGYLFDGSYPCIHCETSPPPRSASLPNGELAASITIW